MALSASNDFFFNIKKLQLRENSNFIKVILFKMRLQEIREIGTMGNLEKVKI